jgi:hypothetical protein
VHSFLAPYTRTKLAQSIPTAGQQIVFWSNTPITVIRRMEHSPRFPKRHGRLHARQHVGARRRFAISSEAEHKIHRSRAEPNRIM